MRSLLARLGRGLLSRSCPLSAAHVSVRLYPTFPVFLPFCWFSTCVSLFIFFSRTRVGLFIQLNVFHVFSRRFAPAAAAAAAFSPAPLSVFLALRRCLSPTLPFTSRLWILLSNTYVARASARVIPLLCVRARAHGAAACAWCARTHTRTRRCTLADEKARVLIPIRHGKNREPIKCHFSADPVPSEFYLHRARNIPMRRR